MKYVFTCSPFSHKKRSDGAREGIGQSVSLILYVQGPGFSPNTEKVKEAQYNGCQGKGKSYKG